MPAISASGVRSRRSAASPPVPDGRAPRRDRDRHRRARAERRRHAPEDIEGPDRQEHEGDRPARERWPRPTDEPQRAVRLAEDEGEYRTGVGRTRAFSQPCLTGGSGRRVSSAQLRVLAGLTGTTGVAKRASVVLRGCSVSVGGDLWPLRSRGFPCDRRHGPGRRSRAEYRWALRLGCVILACVVEGGGHDG